MNNISNIKNLISKLKKKSLMPDVVVHCMGGGLGLRQPILDPANWSLLLKNNFLSGVEINNQLIHLKKKKKSYKSYTYLVLPLCLLVWGQ